MVNSLGFKPPMTLKKKEIKKKEQKKKQKKENNQCVLNIKYT